MTAGSAHGNNKTHDLSQKNSPISKSVSWKPRKTSEDEAGSSLCHKLFESLTHKHTHLLTKVATSNDSTE